MDNVPPFINENGDNNFEELINYLEFFCTALQTDGKLFDTGELLQDSNISLPSIENSSNVSNPLMYKFILNSEKRH